MVKEVDHGIMSSTATTTVETAKGAVKTVLFSMLAGGLMLATLGFGVTALLPALVAGEFTTAMGAVGTTTALVLGAVGTALGGLVGAFASPIGAIAGFANGRHRVHAEQTKFDRAQAVHMDMAARPEAVQAQMMQAAQMGYAKGAQDTEQLIRQQLQQAQYAAIQEEMAKQQMAQQKTAAHGKENCTPCGKHTAAEAQRREAAAAAGVTQRA